MAEWVWVVAAPPGPVRLRPEIEADAEFRFGLFCASRPDAWGMAQLDPVLLASLMRQQFCAQGASHRAQFPQAAFDIVEHAGERMGRLVVDRSADRIHVVDLAIVPASRGLGLGTAIMRALMAEAALASLPVRLNVASGNEPAVRLYTRLGFAVQGATPGYLEMVWPRAS